jgi:hypothetical protein
MIPPGFEGTAVDVAVAGTLAGQGMGNMGGRQGKGDERREADDQIDRQQDACPGFPSGSEHTDPCQKR